MRCPNCGNELDEDNYCDECFEFFNGLDDDSSDFDFEEENGRSGYGAFVTLDESGMERVSFDDNSARYGWSIPGAAALGKRRERED